ncbi:MAG: hypothetical protein COW24_03845 [Candidatus Kerfeldbacteria bacterium CG15_BIG_FIL_POST_REV_8_21_14_020_45_12]|uniref:Polymerase nucleotidyl transferase domain-containing protein n=1 Tax=Candidatus Kerfeldbacteria bacterium CG15_BIG_FIL_POST_REV_8_21_14_020_45_12 TaxID=2014247 RepID=A0A2M7H350_9BACT|nr:MAG: hypothetical protein COW24_03845 [Candidatus Kerfeldbacteria bacterium CG15_BIG_FIL_POST_REV_8_21_14_020_45_12]PJA93541.1 MAG: hypothetical protein CO132_02830 [Candidatus Kerfeldbacteria bacterium CG_4_9_14_3_um_filter_45_8]
MTTLTQQLHSTVLYFDMFDFAPTLLELERWLLASPNSTDKAVVSLGEIAGTLATDPRITSAEGFYFLTNRMDLVRLRKDKYNNVDSKWKHAKPYLRILAIMPGIEGIWLTNSMGWGNARKTSDIDLFIITTPGKIWSARFFTTAFMKIFKQRPHEQSEEKAICLSMYLSSDHLNVKTYKIGADDIPFTFWVNQIYPIYDNGHFEKFKSANEWISAYFQQNQWLKPINRRLIKPTRFELGIKKFLTLISVESLMRSLQLRMLPPILKNMANEDNRVVINDKILKLHTNDRRDRQQLKWERRLHETA